MFCNKKIVVTLILVVSVSVPFFFMQVYAGEMGRLFTTPKERAQLDKIRRNTGLSKQGSEGQVKMEQQPNTDSLNVNVNGVVIRSDGKNVVWVNGKSKLMDRTANDLKLNTSDLSKQKIEVPVSVPHRNITLKPGQIYDADTGSVVEAYQLKEDHKQQDKSALCGTNRVTPGHVELRCD